MEIWQFVVHDYLKLDKGGHGRTGSTAPRKGGKIKGSTSTTPEAVRGRQNRIIRGFLKVGMGLEVATTSAFNKERLRKAAPELIKRLQDFEALKSRAETTKDCSYQVLIHFPKSVFSKPKYKIHI